MQDVSVVNRWTGKWICSNEFGEELGAGSCFPITKEHVVTNYHVIQVGPQGTIQFKDAPPMPVEGIVAWDEHRDLAIAKLSKGHPCLSPLSLARNMPAVGDDVYAHGSPSGLSNTVSRGIISAIRSAVELEPYGIEGLASSDVFIQIDAAISPGSSGGPLCLKDGMVVGVSAFGIASGQGLNFGVPIQQVAALYDNRHSPRPLADFCPLLNVPAWSRTPADHVIRLMHLLCIADGEVAPEEQEAVQDYLRTLIDRGLISFDDAYAGIAMAIEDVEELGYSGALVDSLMQLASGAPTEFRGHVADVLSSLASADGYVDSAERDYWRLLLTAWPDICEDN